MQRLDRGFFDSTMASGPPSGGTGEPDSIPAPPETCTSVIAAWYADWAVPWIIPPGAVCPQGSWGWSRWLCHMGRHTCLTEADST